MLSTSRGLAHRSSAFGPEHRNGLRHHLHRIDPGIGDAVGKNRDDRSRFGCRSRGNGLHLIEGEHGSHIKRKALRRELAN